MDLPTTTASERDDLGLLAVMDALVEEEQVSQRELARRTGLNLKKVNYCLHRLLEKGHVKFQRVLDSPNKRAYLYILTPAGLQAKSQLTYGFLRHTLRFYNEVEARLEAALQRLAASGVRRLVLYGASEVARIVLGLVEPRGVEVVGVVDGVLGGAEFHGVPTLRPGDLAEVAWDGVLITALGDPEQAEARLRALGVPDECVWRLS